MCEREKKNSPTTTSVKLKKKKFFLFRNFLPPPPTKIVSFSKNLFAFKKKSLLNPQQRIFLSKNVCLRVKVNKFPLSPQEKRTKSAKRKFGFTKIQPTFDWNWKSAVNRGCIYIFTCACAWFQESQEVSFFLFHFHFHFPFSSENRECENRGKKMSPKNYWNRKVFENVKKKWLFKSK